MNRRIKTVWTLSVVTAIIVFCAQGYWLYNQLQYNIERNTVELKSAVEKTLDEDLELRYGKVKRVPKTDKDAIRTAIKLVIGDSTGTGRKATEPPRNRRRAQTTVTFTTKHGTRRVPLRGFSLDDALQLSSRYEAQQTQRFSKTMLDSILRSHDCDTTATMRFYKTDHCMVRPQFSVSGNVGRTLSVRYSVDPINYLAVVFTVPVPVGRAVASMGWQLLFSVLMFAVLCFCMTYLIRTIVFQKRIDRLRHEFIKSMMYEQKAAPDVDPAPKDAVRIGRTDFYYSANELRCGQDRVIITSRQAEILRLLADRKNEVVSREELLNDVWGDDSYSNSRALNVQITYLRRALNADETINIEAVIRKGYSLRENK